jgi:hypothetical protein
MTDKTDPNEGVLNPRLLTFPQDKTGFLYKMKNEALMDTLKVLYLFAKRRYEMQAETRAAAIAAAAARGEASEPEATEAPAEPEQPTGDDPVKQEGQSEPTKTEGAADGTN